MDEFPTVPKYLAHPEYGKLPTAIVEALEQSGIVGYLTANDEGSAAFKVLVDSVSRTVAADNVTALVEPELFLRAMCAGWIRMALTEVQCNSVASTADEYYKGLFAARAERQNKPQATTSGMKGFSEEITPTDWDFAMGVIKGFRKWSIKPDEDVLQGSYNKDFLSHEMLPDGRRVGTCHQSGSKHPPEEVPADTGCGCGWWAYWAPEEAHKHGGGGGVGSINVTIAVEGSGRVVIGQKGFRSQYVRVSGIAPESPDADLDAMRAFSRKHLLDAPVYGTVEALREGAGVDPTYGTFAARYPELSGHNDRALSAYVWYLMHVIREEEHFLRDLNAKNSIYRGSDALGNVYVPGDQTELDGLVNYVKISHDLLVQEQNMITRIIVERGKAPADHLDDMRREEHDRLQMPDDPFGIGGLLP